MRFLVTAGPTREPIDPVRFLSNRSSGRMGYSIAEAARDAGHSVVLVSGPVSLKRPAGIDLVLVETAEEMFDAVSGSIRDAAVAVFAAAVADYRPVKFSGQKIKKSEGGMVIELVKNRDILGAAREEFGFRGALVGFAAETENVIPNAISKLGRKGCDLMVANDVSKPDIGFDSEDNAVVFCYPDGRTNSVEKTTKRNLAVAIVSECERLVRDKTEHD